MWWSQTFKCSCSSLALILNYGSCGECNQEDRDQKKKAKLYFSYDTNTIYIIVMWVPYFSSQCMLLVLSNVQSYPLRCSASHLEASSWAYFQYPCHRLPVCRNVATDPDCGHCVLCSFFLGLYFQLFNKNFVAIRTKSQQK